MDRNRFFLFGEVLLCIRETDGNEALIRKKKTNSKKIYFFPFTITTVCSSFNGNYIIISFVYILYVFVVPTYQENPLNFDCRGL